MYLPRLIAGTHAEALAQLAERRAILLDAAAEKLDLAEAFNATGDYSEIVAGLTAEARSLFAQAQRHIPGRAA